MNYLSVQLKSNQGSSNATITTSFGLIGFSLTRAPRYIVYIRMLLQLALSDKKRGLLVTMEREGDRPSGSRGAVHSPSMKPTSKSPILPLAPLEYLQNQRRGSITDPSLHAASNQRPTPNSQFFRQANDSSAGPSSSYVFGDATAIPNENPALRKILRSPSAETEKARATEGAERFGKYYLILQERYLISPEARRPSTAGSEQAIIGTKRKVSMDRGILGETQLAGPGVSGMEVEMEAPPPKRRGSAIDTRVAQLSLNDRRNSVDSRATWGWTTSNNDRPTWAPETLAQPAGRPAEMAVAATTFGAWPSAHSSESNNMQHQVDPNQNPSAPLHMMPPINFNPDRRMSVPNVLSASPPSSGPTRVLRSRSRPPSRQSSRAENPQSASPSGQEEIPGDPSGSKLNKEPGQTPYSRSPELRVSHKLAERKRRKEMKELFDELRDQLPADRGMKASKWEILSKGMSWVFFLSFRSKHREFSH